MKIKLIFLHVFEFMRDGFYVGIFLLLPFIAKDLKLTFFQVGSLQSIVNIMPIIMAFPVTFLSVKIGGMKTLIFSLALYAIVFSSVFYVSSFFFLLIIFIIAGISFSFYSVNSSHLITKWSTRETMGKQLGNLMATGDIAKALCSVFISFAVGVIGWRLVSLSTGIITGIIFLLFYFLYVTYIEDKDDKLNVENKLGNISYKHFFKHKKFVMALLANSLDMGVNTPFYAFLPFLLLNKNVPVMWLGVFTGFYYFGNILSRIIFGRLIDKIGNAKIFIFLEITMAIITVCLILSPTLFLTACLALSLGFITEGTDPATLSMFAESLEKIGHSQKAFSIRTMTNGISRVLFPLFLGIIASKAGIFAAFYVIAFATLIPVIPAYIFLKNKE